MKCRECGEMPPKASRIIGVTRAFFCSFTHDSQPSNSQATHATSDNFPTAR